MEKKYPCVRIKKKSTCVDFSGGSLNIFLVYRVPKKSTLKTPLAEKGPALSYLSNIRHPPTGWGLGGSQGLPSTAAEKKPSEGFYLGQVLHKPSEAFMELKDGH